MADHVRKQIRDALAAVLAAIDAAPAVYVGRRPAIDPDHLPALVILTPGEESERAAKNGWLARRLDVEIEAHQVAADILTAFDALAVQIETAMAAAGSLGGLIKAVDLTATDYEYNIDAVTTAGMIRLTYRIEYMTTETAPDVAL